MTSFKTAALLAFTCISLQNAQALSVDDKTMNNGNAERFSDPDDRAPSQIISMSPSSVQDNLGYKETSPTGTDPSSIRYDYDPSSGSYVPHNRQ